MNSTSSISISRSALKNNYAFLKDIVGPSVRISSVVKGNAYGHGIKDFVPVAHELGIDHFSVFSADEAYEVVQSCHGHFDLMIMGEVDDEALEWTIVNEVQYFVFDLDRLEKSIKVAKRLRKVALVHVEAETGMNRTGFNIDELKKVKELLLKSKDYVRLMGLCTHFAGAESIANYLRIQQQLNVYNRITKFFVDSGFTDFVRHTACSASMMMLPQTRMDLVRIGIMQYGFWPSPETFIRFIGDNPEREDPLKRIMSWKSKVIALKDVEAGEFIGYGTSYIARHKMRIAILPVGYAHGYSRTLSNQGRILIRGQRVGVVGMINMNMLSVDVSEIPHIEKGDEAVLIGEQGDLSLSVASFSEFSNQLNYEMLTRLSSNITRKIIE